MLKVLNLYAGIGGNRKLWEDVEVTVVELNPEIAKIYQDFFPNDKVIVGDAHQYLLEHYKEYEFIWSSPPCPTHSRFNFLLNVQEGRKIKYPNMKLYEEIILLKTWFKGKYCIENVISYYKPLIAPIESGTHYYWTNFYFKPMPNITRHIKAITGNNQGKLRNEKLIKIDLTKYKLRKQFERQLINNCVEPEHGNYILQAARDQFPPVTLELFTDISTNARHNG